MQPTRTNNYGVAFGRRPDRQKQERILSMTQLSRKERDACSEFIGQRMKLLGQRARDPNHPMHRKIAWDKNGMPILPASDEELAALILAALDEPEDC
jgi:hypothetical protein